MIIANKYITKMSNKLQDSEFVTGTLSGSLAGVFTFANWPDALLTCLVAIVTGFLGAAGSHLFKIIKEKLKQRKNGKQESE